MKTAINKELLFAHFDGRTTPLQIELLREWLQTSENQQLYYTWLQEWEHQHPQVITNPEIAYAVFQQKIRAVPQRDETNRVLKLNQWNLRAYYLAASVAALVITLGFFTRDYWSMRTIATDYGEVRSIVLPDGSRVTLNANSELRIPRFHIGPASREVFLVGEAEFAIVHTPSHDHFRVHTPNEVDVIVLGTEFVVNSRRNKTRVVLNRGKVQLRYPTPNQIKTLIMKPGDWVNLSANEPPKKGHQPVEQTTAAAWKNYQYNFQRTPMPEIAELLADNFGLVVQMDSALAHRNVTGTFHAQNADELIQALVELFDFDVIRQGKGIKLISPESTQRQ
ncbi:FecR family protein [Spirosoma sp. KCTC 42546]|uniref:FecR family protein n=1 Tax=Spirosoma sp. KCTC 42546 TaxID=2520506 RepID=UPI00143CF832|nr:FecR domain-containing protein [Spirosoma sp. KCTC 42546]